MIKADWLSCPATQAVFAMLSGAQAYAVGGCVRNALLGAPVSDIDIATSALPEDVLARARACGLKAIPTGIEHGTITVISGGIAHEITTFRRDVETDGRRATVAFSDQIAEDAARRDFTMNALYADARGQVYDPLGEGLADLRARRLRFVGVAEARIREDYLRILRFFRFTAWYGREIEPEGLAACASLSEGIAALSRERVGHEIRKLLAAPDPCPAIGAMQASGVLAATLIGADPRGLYPFVHLRPQSDWLARLAALGGADLPETLRLSKPEARSLSALQEALGSLRPPHELGYRLGARAYDAVALRAALFETPLPADWEADVARGMAAQFPLKAADLPDLKGPALGQALKALEQSWIRASFQPSRDDLLMKARDL